MLVESLGMRLVHCPSLILAQLISWLVFPPSPGGALWRARDSRSDSQSDAGGEVSEREEAILSIDNYQSVIARIDLNISIDDIAILLIDSNFIN